MIAFHSKEMYIWNITKSMTGKVPMFGKFLASATVLLVLGLGAGCSFTNSSRQIVALTTPALDEELNAMLDSMACELLQSKHQSSTT